MARRASSSLLRAWVALVLLALATAFCGTALAQSDPLNSAYKPAIDCNPADYPSNVALSGAFVKLRMDSGSPATVTGSAPCVTIYATQNEIQPFQVHVQAPAGGYSALSITVSALSKSTGPGGAASIPAPDATHTNIVPYQELYMDELIPTAGPNYGTFIGIQPLVSGTTTTGTTTSTIFCTSCNFTTSGVVAGMFACNADSGTNDQCENISTVNSATQITVSTAFASMSSGKAFWVYAPAYVPDGLMPTIDPYFHQTTLANSVIVPGSPCTATDANPCNQSYWVDVLVPETAPSGWYSGTVTIKNGATTIATLPVLYGVWQWPASAGGFMPSTATLKSWLGIGYPGQCDQMFGSHGADCSYDSVTGDAAITKIQQDAASFFLDHRYSLDGTVNTFPCNSSGVCGSFANFETLYAPFFNGTNANVTQLLAGARLTGWDISNHTTLGGGSGLVPAGTLSGFQSEWTTKGWTNSSPLFIYGCDEPSPQGGGTAIGTCITNLLSNHSATTPSLPNLVTATENFVGAQTNGNTAVDVLVSSVNCFATPEAIPGTDCNNSEPTTDYTTTFLPLTSLKQWWWYIACGSSGNCGTGFVGNKTDLTYAGYDVDNVPVANQALEWINLYTGASSLGTTKGSTGELYYSGDVCAPHSGQGTNCGNNIYPAGHPYNPSVSNYYAGGWGDGTWVYYSGVGYTPSSFSWSAGVGTLTVPTAVTDGMVGTGAGQYVYLYGFTPALCATNVCPVPITSFTTTPGHTISFTLANNPGTITVYGSVSFGYPSGTTVPLIYPSMRIQYVRDGMEDYELGNLLNGQGKASVVNAAIASWIATDGTTVYCFNTNPIAGQTMTEPNCTKTFTGDITDARISEGNAMQALTFGGGQATPAPSNLRVIVARAIESLFRHTEHSSSLF